MIFNLRECFQRLWGTFNRRDRETDEELRFHLEMAEKDALRRGQSVREARLRAGSVMQACRHIQRLRRRADPPPPLCRCGSARYDLGFYGQDRRFVEAQPYSR